MNRSNIVTIPPKMERYYGKGTMLHPAHELVEEAIERIPEGKVATIDALCRKLAQDSGTTVTCPMRTGNAIKRMAQQTVDGQNDNLPPVWRMLRKDHTMLKLQNLPFWAAKLEEEGQRLEFVKGEKIKVFITVDNLFEF